MSKVNSDLIGKSKLLIEGMKKNLQQAKNMGLDELLIERFLSETEMASAQNDECERLKAELKSKTLKTNMKRSEKDVLSIKESH